MTKIYVTECNTKCYEVTFENKGWIKVQKFEDISDDKNTIHCVKPSEIILGKSESCMMTAYSGAFNKPVFDGKTILLKISEENNKNKYLYFRGDMVCSFLTIVKIYKYISNLVNNLIPYSIAKGEEKIYFLNQISSLLKEKILKIINRWKKMKVSLICLITMVQIAEKPHLKN